MSTQFEEIKFHSSLNSIDRNKWDAYLEKHPHYSIFQSFEMYAFWKEQENHEPFLYFFEYKNGKCLAMCSGVVVSNGNILKKAFSRRAIIYGGPLIDDSANSETFNYVLNTIEHELRSQAIYVEFRNFFDLSSYKTIFKKNNWQYIPYQNYFIDLDSEEKVFMGFDNEKRRQIRKALRENVNYTFNKEDQLVKDVYKVLKYIYIERAKKPFPDFAFFKNLLKMEQAGMVAVIFEQKVIGGGFFLIDKNSIYDWYRGGYDSDYAHKYPSSVADWAIMKYAIERNIKRFDFMGAGIKGVEYGVRTYKSRFGGELVEYGRFIKINKPIMYYIGNKALIISRRVANLKKLRIF